jgi:hypothetical protein
MPTLEAFFSAAKSIVSLGATANANNRAQIRTIVGGLADQLDRALVIADVYLAGALVIQDSKELEAYLLPGYSKVMQDFHEYKVCSALYQLADEFSQVFDTKRLSVSMGEMSEIRELIDRLRDGERAVIDSLDAIIQRLYNLALELQSAGPRKALTVRRRVSSAVEESRTQIASQRKQIKAIARRINDKM